jgi:carboxylate-amine ligase
VNRVLKPLGGLLMPSGMHPWMDPRTETRLWPHRYRKIYATYDRIFNCRRHGWANLQSIHVNISFRGDAEFAKLHAAIRLLIPVIPALASSSPVAGGKISGYHDTRLAYYRSNQRKVPSVMGRIVPEPVYTEAEYRKGILEKMYRDIAPYDPEGTIRYEWLNSRGAIPRFGRNAFEIRVIDTQECPTSNIAVSELIVAAIRLLVSERWAPLEEQKKWAVSPLVSIFRKTIRSGETARVDNARYLRTLGFAGAKASAGELWGHLAEEAGRRRLLSDKSLKTVRSILDQGTLSSRILRSLGGDVSRARLKAVYGELCRCLARNEMFTG